MKNIFCSKTAVLLFVMLSLNGCKSKQEAPATSTGSPQEKAAQTAPATVQVKPGIASNQDKADAQAAAVRVLALLESGDFPALYRDAAAGFKQIGSEDQFVAKFQDTRKRVGVLKNPQQISVGTLPGNGYVLQYRVENDLYKTDYRLTFARSQSGKMELAGLNQHDELKK
ncbi:hypothetical protein OR1_00314 [Geobacter sp. OR-1]|uniref:DUF4019 domain-containing protein n=1 Tax=Geobacter sp. OR-1 TaxID=1266765 RepID=UPI000543A6E3|nr:DUF4019 domain-containing protein [Geobacter sp. OR-1]GAM08044.1 hypothetical protein OR1_00314 [Geobacter sp. OR-1]